VIVSPKLANEEPGAAVFARLNDGTPPNGMVSETCGEVTLPSVAVARLVTSNNATSFPSTTYDPSQVMLWVGSNPPGGNGGQTTEAMRLSVTVIGSTIVVLPELVTK
jgi:hypothetical protein